MAVVEGGTSTSLAEVGAAAAKGLHVITKPDDYGTLGHYRLATTVPLIAVQAANGTLFSFRWGDATRLCIVRYIGLQLMQTTAATATIMPSYQVFVARSFSVSDSVGTAITLTGNNMKKRTSMGTTLVTDIRKSAVAAGLTAGTRTLDAEPILEMTTNSTITTPNAIQYRTVLDLTSAGDMPYVFAQNEGFIVRGPTVVFGAAGTANLDVEVAWEELASY
jgi:hypothetical protein